MVRTVSYTFSGSAILGKRLMSLVNALEKPAALWEEIGLAMMESTRLRISDQEDIDGLPFKPSIRAQEQGGQTLRDTGRLMNSITFASDKNGVEWGVPADIPYAWILNEGGTIVPKTKPALKFKINGRWVTKASVTIPRRQFVGFSGKDKQEVLSIISDYLKGA